MAKNRLGKRERKARLLAKMGRLARRNAARDNSLQANKAGGCRTHYVNPMTNRVVPVASILASNKVNVLDSDRTQTRTHHLTAFRAGVSNLKFGHVDRLGVDISAPNSAVGSKAKAANRRDMKRSLGTESRFTKAIAGSVHKRSPSRPDNHFKVVRGWQSKTVTLKVRDKDTGEEKFVKVHQVTPKEVITEGTV